MSSLKVVGLEVICVCVCIPHLLMAFCRCACVCVCVCLSVSWRCLCVFSLHMYTSPPTLPSLSISPSHLLLPLNNDVT